MSPSAVIVILAVLALLGVAVLALCLSAATELFSDGWTDHENR